jgi:nitrite reductase (NADH) small subunit
MAQEFALGSANQIPQGEGRAFIVEKDTIAVFHTRGGEVFAVQAACPHRQGPLADGLVGDATVTCPLHERSFDLRTGAGIGTEDCLKRFAIRLSEHHDMFVAIE